MQRYRIVLRHKGSSIEPPKVLLKGQTAITSKKLLTARGTDFGLNLSSNLIEPGRGELDAAWPVLTLEFQLPSSQEWKLHSTLSTDRPYRLITGRNDSTLVDLMAAGARLHVQLPRAPFILMKTVTGPFEAIVRPGPGGQRNAGFPDCVCRVGSRPYCEGAVVRMVKPSELNDETIMWGFLHLGWELILQNPESSDVTFYTGGKIASIEALQAASLVS